MKTAKILTILVLASAIMVWTAEVGEADPVPMGTAFTYQGHLYDNNDVANGLYDFRFSLYADPCVGSPIGSDVNVHDMDVIDGYFTVQLDFNSPSAFYGYAHWLEIGVRQGELSDPCAYTPLSPRQEVTPTPYALYAKTTGSVPVPLTLTGSTMMSPDAIISAFNTGDGDGVRGFSQNETGVSGEGGVSGVMGYSTTDAGVRGLSDSGNGVEGWSTSGYAGYFYGDTKITQDLIVDGNVGIGTVSPSEKLEVVGTVKATAFVGDGSGLTNLPAGTDGDWTISGSDIYSTVAGNVGIGIPTPGAKLEVVGSVMVSGTVDGVDVSNHAANANAHHTPPAALPPSGSAGGDLSGTYPNPSVVDDSHIHGDATLLSNISINNTRLYAPAGAGNVGIGTTNPLSKLSVGGVGQANTGVYGSGSNYGAVFKAEGSTGIGVYGDANNTGNERNYGGLFQAAGGYGIGVWGYAAGLSGCGVYGVAADSNGNGCGVWGEAMGITGRGVYGKAWSDSSRGVYGEAPGTYSFGIYGNASGIYGTGVVGYAPGSSGKGVAGNGNAYDFDATGPGVNYGATSSIRWKRDIEPIDKPLDKLMQLRGVYFNWDPNHGGRHDVGMIAEEVGKVLPEIVVYEENGIDTSGMDYSKTTPLLVEAVKALKTENDELRKRLADLEATIKTITPLNQGDAQ